MCSHGQQHTGVTLRSYSWLACILVAVHLCSTQLAMLKIVSRRCCYHCLYYISVIRCYSRRDMFELHTFGCAVALVNIMTGLPAMRVLT